MELTWLSIMGITIRVGIDVARYAALRTKRRSHPGEEGGPQGVAPVEPQPGETQAQGSRRMSAGKEALVCRWTRVADGPHLDPQLKEAQPPFVASGRLVCRWTVGDQTL